MTRGAVGPYLLFPQLLDDLDMLKTLEVEASSDPNVLCGVSCCPGTVEGVVRVVTSNEQTSVSCTELYCEPNEHKSYMCHVRIKSDDSTFTVCFCRV